MENNSGIKHMQLEGTGSKMIFIGRNMEGRRKRRRQGNGQSRVGMGRVGLDLVDVLERRKERYGLIFRTLFDVDFITYYHQAMLVFSLCFCLFVYFLFSYLSIVPYRVVSILFYHCYCLVLR